MRVLLIIIGLVAVIHASPRAEETDLPSTNNEEIELFKKIIEESPSSILVPESKVDNEVLHPESRTSPDHEEVRSIAGTSFSNNNRLPAETLWNNLLADLNNISSTNPSFNTTSFVSQLSELITSLAATAANTQVQQVLTNWVQNIAPLFNRPNRYRPNQPPPSSLTVIDVTDPKKPLQISKTSAHFSVKDIYEPSSGQHQEEENGNFYQPQYSFNTFAQRRPYYPSYPHPYHYGYQQRPAPVPYPYGFPYYFNHRQYQENHDEQQNNYFRQPTDHPVNPTIGNSELSDLEALAQLEQLLRNEEEAQRTVVSSNQRSDDGELEVEGRGLISSITTGAQAVRSNVKSIIKSIHSNLPTVSYKTLLVPSFGSPSSN